MFFNGNFIGTAFGHPALESDDLSFGSNGRPCEVKDDGPSVHATQAGGFDLNITTGDLSAAEIENWWLAPSVGDATQYSESTLFDVSQNELAGPGWASEASNSEVHGFDPFGRPARLSLSPPTTSTGDVASPSPVPTLSWGYSPPPTETYTPSGNDPFGVYDQPLAAPDLCGQWPYPTSAGKGKARAADHVFPSPPQIAGNTTRQDKPSEGYGGDANPRMYTCVYNTPVSTQVEPSTGPQRSARCAKGKGKRMDKNEGRWKRIPKKDLAPGVDWPATCRRFCAEMAKICFDQPTGEVINPETAYANITQFVKNDLHLSPLTSKHLGERPTRDLEQYLLGILNELRPRIGGQKKGVRYMLERVARELENGLVVVNDDFSLLEGPSNETDPEELDASEIAAKHRTAEQVRREAVRRSLERITLFFKRPEPGYRWSRPQVLFYAIAYIVFGARVFGDGGEFFTPKPQP